MAQKRCEKMLSPYLWLITVTEGAYNSKKKKKKPKAKHKIRKTGGRMEGDRVESDLQNYYIIRTKCSVTKPESIQRYWNI
jgi:hypothetical protein